MTRCDQLLLVEVNFFADADFFFAMESFDLTGWNCSKVSRCKKWQSASINSS